MPALPDWINSAMSHLCELNSLQLMLILTNVLLLFFARPLFRIFARKNQVSEAELFEGGAFTLVQRANLISLLCVALYAFVIPLNQHFGFTKVLSALLILSVANMLSSVLDVILLRRFGKEKSVDGVERYVETYRSRLVSLISTGMISVIAILLIVRMIGFESLLETGGVIGFIGVLLALTQGSWAPDLISGLIILNTGLLEEGDVIEINTNKLVIGVIFKTRMFHTEVLDLATNHRVLIPNAQLRQGALHNLSKFASARGLRERLTFKIGYDVRQSEVRTLFEEVFETAQADNSIPINDVHGFELRILDTGDFAIEWGFFYYLKEVKQLFSTRHALLALSAKLSEERGISLATPVLYQRVGAEEESLEVAGAFEGAK